MEGLKQWARDCAYLPLASVQHTFSSCFQCCTLSCNGSSGCYLLALHERRERCCISACVAPCTCVPISECVTHIMLLSAVLQESTLGVELLSSASRRGASGARLYDYEYQLDSTRGLKRIFNTVTITGAGGLLLMLPLAAHATQLCRMLLYFWLCAWRTNTFMGTQFCGLTS